MKQSSTSSGTKTSPQEERFFGGGFTILELLTVIAIILVLTTLVIFAASRSIAKATSVNCISNLRQLDIQMTSFVTEFDRYPLFTASPADTMSLPGQKSTWLSSIAYDELRTVSNNKSNMRPKSIVLCPSI